MYTFMYTYMYMYVALLCDVMPAAVCAHSEEGCRCTYEWEGESCEQPRDLRCMGAPRTDNGVCTPGMRRCALTMQLYCVIINQVAINVFKLVSFYHKRILMLVCDSSSHIFLRTYLCSSSECEHACWQCWLTD